MSATTTNTTTSELFTPARFGAFEMRSRVVMAPLTRLRADDAGVPGELVAEHYAQRAGIGLIVTEGTFPTLESQAYIGQPGIATDEQAAGWAQVANAVHDRGGTIVMQLMHAGRVTHPDVNGGRRVLAPSAIAIDGLVHTPRGKQPQATPEAMTSEDIRAVIAGFAQAARRAVDAGLDGVEIHSANGYLLHQFLAPTSNQRSDEYGGSPASRARFVVEVIRAVVEEIGADRVGVRISPEHNIQGALETDREDVLATYGLLLDRVRPFGLAYLSLLHQDAAGEFVERLAARFDGPIVANTGFSSVTEREDAERLLGASFIDAVAVGRAAIANPDLVERWRGAHALNAPRSELFYGRTAEGYTDYPFL